MTKMTFAEFAAKYCERQEQTPEGLREVLREQRVRLSPSGWFIAECQMLDSSWMGQLVILPYGPNNTFKEVPPPHQAFSPRGLASDMSTAVAFMEVADLDT